MKLSQFKFKLPEELIALYPHSIYREFENDNGEKETFRITRRDECRLMVLHKKSQTIEMYKKDADGNDLPEVDWTKTKAIHTRCNSIYINLKGRDPYGIGYPQLLD